MNNTFDVYGLGQCALDFLGIIPSYPAANSKCEFSDLVVQDGGPIATALVALQRWGFSCAFSGVIGDDQYGQQIIDSIRSESVDTSRVKVRTGFDSQVAFAMAQPATGQRTIFWRRPTGPDLDPGEIDQDLLQDVKVFHTDGIFPEASVTACKIAQKTGTLVSIDAGSMRPGMLDLAANSNFFIASETFANSYAPGESPEQVCRSLSELGAELVAVTLGEKGYIAFTKGNIINGKAHRVNTIDTTGCGDLFHAGFIYGILKNWEIKKCLEFAAWAAAMVSRFLGGRKGIPLASDWND